MKLPKQFVIDLTRDMQKVYNANKDILAGRPENQVKWWLFNRVIDDRSHDDNHPRFSDRMISVLDRQTMQEISQEPRKADIRLIPHIPLYSIIRDVYDRYEVNDSHIETAIKAAWNNLIK